MSKRRRTEIAKIANRAARLVTYSKRRKGLFKKASELCHLCGARAAVIVFSPAGKLCSFGEPSAEEVISEYIGGNGDVVATRGLTECEDWIEDELNSCATGEDLDSLIVKYEAAQELVLKRLEDLEKKSSVAIGNGDSGAGLGSNSENLNHKEIDFVLASFKSRRSALSEDCLRDGSGNAFLTSPEKPATGAGSLRVDSTPTCSHHEGCGFNPDTSLRLSRDCIDDGGHDSFSTSLDNSAIGGGSSRVDSNTTCSHLEGCGFDPDTSLRLSRDWP